jgi:CRISPR-associated endonuclease/helicase Cas3
MLSQLRARHSWLRAWCLARLLLIIDEVHASDPYMSEIVTRLVNEHLALGGYVLLMSATLGEALRAKLEHRQRVDVAIAAAMQYPLVSTPSGQIPVHTTGVRTTIIIIEGQIDALTRAVATVGRGEAILWIRSTVADALDDYHAFQAAWLGLLQPIAAGHLGYHPHDFVYVAAILSAQQWRLSWQGVHFASGIGGKPEARGPPQ